MSPFRVARLLRVAAALALLAAAIFFFEAPLRSLYARAGNAGNPLDRVLGPSQGFFARISSRPSGAAVEIDGKLRGETPFLGNVACSPGEKVAVAIAAPGYRPWRRELDCRKDGQVEINATLER